MSDGPAQEEDWGTQIPGWGSLTEPVVNKSLIVKSLGSVVRLLGFGISVPLLNPPTLLSHSPHCTPYPMI